MTWYEDKDFNLWTSKALFLLQEKLSYLHDDKPVRPFLIIDTDGPYLNEAPLKKVWLSFIDLEKLECIHSIELKFKFLPLALSWLTASDFF